jgi:hypothetical protein
VGVGCIDRSRSRTRSRTRSRSPVYVNRFAANGYVNDRRAGGAPMIRHADKTASGTLAPPSEAHRAGAWANGRRRRGEWAQAAGRVRSLAFPGLGGSPHRAGGAEKHAAGTPRPLRVPKPKVGLIGLIQFPAAALRLRSRQSCPAPPSRQPLKSTKVVGTHHSS